MTSGDAVFLSCRAMQGIPPARDTDAEDVVWGLQTAASLWKRGERIDAVVWLRRAAQAAGDANDDDRALELARAAAELSDAMAAAPSVPPGGAPTFAPGAPTFAPGAEAAPPPAQATVPPESSSVDVDVDVETPRPPSSPFFPAPFERPRPPAGPPPSSPTMQTAEPSFDEHANEPAPEERAPLRTPLVPAPSPDDEEPRTSVPPADKVHAGMFNPWDETKTPSAPPPPAPSPPAPPVVAMPSPVFVEGDEEVVTSVRPQALEQQRAEAAAKQASSAPAPSAPPAPSAKPPVPRPPPLPPRARPPKPPPPKPAAPATEPPAAAAPEPPAAPPAPEPPAPEPPAPEPPAPEPPAPEPPAAAPPAAAPPAPEAAPPAPPTPPPPSPTQQTALAPAEPAEPAAPAPLVLDDIDAFADLPDDARAAFAAAATLTDLAEGEEVGHFALAFVVSGTFDVAATVVDAPAAKLPEHGVLRSRGTTDEGVPMRLICGAARGVVATWSDAAVDEAFRTCPWVEEDLRVAADRVQTLVGITIGPLGERLDPSIREEIVGRLTMKSLAPGERVVEAGEPVPGLLLVGVGGLELVDGEDVKGTVGSGEFLFPGEVLGAGAAPSSARAGAGGALVLFGDRKIAQELLVTCPPLLEVFAGM